MFSGYITVGFTCSKDGYEQYSEGPAVDLDFWEPDLDSDDDNEEI